MKNQILTSFADAEKIAEKIANKGVFQFTYYNGLFSKTCDIRVNGDVAEIRINGLLADRRELEFLPNWLLQNKKNLNQFFDNVR